MSCCSPGHSTDQSQTCGETKRAIWSSEPDSNHYSQCHLSVCVLSLLVNINFMSQDGKEKGDAIRLIKLKRPRPKRHWEVTVPLREREQRATLTWGRDLQLRSKSAVFQVPPPPIHCANHKNSTTHSTTLSAAIPDSQADSVLLILILVLN